MGLKSRTLLLLLGEGALEGQADALLLLKFFHVSCPSKAALEAALSSALHVSPHRLST